MAPSPALTLVAVHAHPDDESSKGPATVARYARAGVRCVLVCCTGGEEGDILNPAMDRPEVRADLGAVRRSELIRAAAVIGYAEVVWLGYRDSGMAGSEANAHPDCFAQADLAEAAGRLAAVLRQERPQVVITYPDDQGGYPHPDHLRVHEATMAAVDLAADGTWEGSGAAWAVPRVYYSAWSRARFRAIHARLLAAGEESPFSEEWLAREGLEHRVTTRIRVPGGGEVRRQALLCHQTQIDPASTFWFPEVAPDAAVTDDNSRDDDLMESPTDDYILATSTVAGTDVRVAGGVAGGVAPEDDLFAGLSP
ncbi:MAG: PIG-L family deacetylase [Acidimicrobiales bacterium]